MAVTTHPLLERLNPLVEMNIHQIAVKKFHYHHTGLFAYNLLIAVLEMEKRGDYFQNVRTGEKTFLRAGHAYLLPCQLPVRYERTPALTVVTMRFNLTFFYGLDIFDGHGAIEEIYAPDFVSLLRHALLDGAGDGADGEQLKTALTLKTEVSRLCLSRWPEHLQGISPRMWKYEGVFLYAKEHADATLSVGKLAEIHGMRQDVFSRSFSRDVGIAPKQYIADLLLRKISKYLLTSQMSMKEIARELNFSSEYYMSRFFKKHTSMPPTDYQKQFLG